MKNVESPNFVIVLLLALAFFMAACGTGSAEVPTEEPPPVEEKSTVGLPPDALVDCLWDADAQIWLDENENSLWDEGEQPLENVQVFVSGTRNRFDRKSGATRNRRGQANLSVWLPGCPEVHFEVYITMPNGYHLTTSDRLQAKGERGEGPFQFGLAYMAGLTPTPRPQRSLICNQVASSVEFVSGLDMEPDGSIVALVQPVYNESSELWRFSPNGDRLDPIDQLPIEFGVGAISFVDNLRF